MAGLDKWLYNFAKRRKVPHIGLTGTTKTVGATSVSVLLENSAGKVLMCSGTSVPTGAGYAIGCIFIKTNAGSTVKALYENIGTATVASFNAIGDITSAELAAGVLQVATVTLAVADIIHATPIKTLVAAPATGYYTQFISATMTYKHNTAAYTGGGNLSIKYTGAATLTGIVAANASFGAAADSIHVFYPLSTAGIVVTKECAIEMATSGQFTQPGTAAGTAEVTIAYRVLPIET